MNYRYLLLSFFTVTTAVNTAPMNYPSIPSPAQLRTTEIGNKLDTAIRNFMLNPDENKVSQIVVMWQQTFGSLELFPIAILVGNVSSEYLKKFIAEHPEININCYITVWNLNEEITAFVYALEKNLEHAEILLQNGADINAEKSKETIKSILNNESLNRLRSTDDRKKIIALLAKYGMNLESFLQQAKTECTQHYPFASWFSKQAYEDCEFATYLENLSKSRIVMPQHEQNTRS